MRRSVARAPPRGATMAETSADSAAGVDAGFYWKATGTFKGPFEPPGLAPTGARVALDGFDLHEYRDGRVSRLRIVFDMADFSRQIGLLPKQGSGIEKAGASVQRLGVHLRDRLRR